MKGKRAGLRGTPTAICVGCDADLGMRITHILGECGMQCSVAPDLDAAIENMDLSGMDLVILQATTKVYAELRDSVRAISSHAPDARFIAVVSDLHRERISGLERVVALPNPMDSWSLIEFCIGIRAIAYAIAASKVEPLATKRIEAHARDS